jgi:hypothetical protein
VLISSVANPPHQSLPDELGGQAHLRFACLIRSLSAVECFFSRLVTILNPRNTKFGLGDIDFSNDEIPVFIRRGINKQ